MEKNPLIIIMLGKSGSGKGTQVSLLTEKYGFKKIGSGELLRERKKNKDFTGSKISSVIDNGGIVLTPVIFKLWMEKLEEIKEGGDINGIIFDGSPRKIKEAFLLDEALEWYEWDKNIKILLIDISDEEVIKRVACRRVCANGSCNFIPNPEQIKELANCPACGSKLEDRPEDSPEGIKKRLAWFKEEVEPVINHYREKNKLITINGNQPIEKVFNDIENAIK